MSLLSITATDSQCISGVSADSRVAQALGIAHQQAITAVTAQGLDRAVESFAIPAHKVAAQIARANAKAVRLGVVASRAQAKMLRAELAKLDAIKVWDPVLFASAGGELTAIEHGDAIALAQQCDLITPNIDEAQWLAQQSIANEADMLAAAKKISSWKIRGVLIKAGHLAGEVNKDLLLLDGEHYWLEQPKLANSARATGCTLAAYIAAFCAYGEPLKDAVALANAALFSGLKQTTHASLPVKVIGWPNQLDDFACIYREQKPNTNFVSIEQALGLYPVVDSVEWVSKLAKAGVKTIQLRIKDVPEDVIEQAVIDCVQIQQQYDLRLFINDYWQLAIKHKAYGVHLGQEDIQEATLSQIADAGVHLGISTHGELEWGIARAYQPSYLAIGAIYPTDTKEVVVVGEERLQRWVHLLSKRHRLTAIGGINLSNLATVLSTSIDSVAVVSAITKAEDWQQAVLELQAMLKEAC
ncbi:thiamine phosphate synthase [Salinibius halmophilus]|uniref:thiamine phosphate synthase n=1 Tax=Salinibius halmophilus TaxID=1853216 RepID=UPI000E660101|nr:thiamine phosphate synthase [Salinibius halmophilus]